MKPLRALAALLAVAGPPATGRAAAAAPLVYVAMGDSTAAGVGAEQGGGYPDRLARRLGAAGTPVRLVNLGVPGATAADLRRDQLHRATGAEPALVTICIGINDLVRGRKLAEFARDLEIVADAVARRTKAAVVISELPDLSRAPAYAGTPNAASIGRRVAAYNAVIRRVAERHRFALGEVEAATRRALADPAHFARDGFHPSARGYEAWAEALWPAVHQAVAPRVQARRPAPATR